MEVKNGIIIDGVLHELWESKSKDCKQCSLFHLCENEFEPSCICWVGLQSESIKETPMFINRGKVTVTLLREEPKSVGEIYRKGVKIDKEE